MWGVRGGQAGGDEGGQACGVCEGGQACGVCEGGQACGVHEQGVGVSTYMMPTHEGGEGGARPGRPHGGGREVGKPWPHVHTMSHLWLPPCPHHDSPLAPPRLHFCNHLLDCLLPQGLSPAIRSAPQVRQHTVFTNC